MATPARVDVGDAFSFWNRQLQMLGQRDPLLVLERTPESLAGLMLHHPAALWEVPARARKWSPAQILGHLLDIEWVFGYRIRNILFDDRPTLMGMDQDRWVAGQDGHGRSPEGLLYSFKNIRSENMRLWRRMSADDLLRTGIHDEAGVEVSLGLLRRIQAGHDLSHLERLDDYLTLNSARSG